MSDWSSDVCASDLDRITPESMKPLAIALCDPAGIGPEIVAKAWSQRKQRRLAPFFAVGDPRSVKAVWDGPVTTLLEPAQATAAFAQGLPVQNGRATV